MTFTADFLKRFWSKVNKTATCWLWMGKTKHWFGYGMITISRKDYGVKTVLYAHRLAWEFFNGPIPGGLFVLHKCDIPACVNPDHLFLGTQADNRQDCASKNRSTQGIRNPRAKLTEWDVQEIRRRTDMPTIALARAFMISKQQINRIRSGFSWKHSLETKL